MRQPNKVKTIGGTAVSAEPVNTFAVTGDCTLTAAFDKIPVDHSHP